MGNIRRKGVLLVGHGTRDPAGQSEFFELARLVAERVDLPLEPCFLELASPSIEAGLARLWERNVEQVITAPLLLFSAGHARRDIPLAVEAAASRHGNIQVVQTEPLGLLPEVVENSYARWLEAVADISAFAAADSLLVMIGRGSSDATATAAMRQLAELRGHGSEVGETLVGFAAVAPPSLDEVLVAAERSKLRHVIVQPHLLFHGELWTDIAEKVGNYASTSAGRNWRVTGPLGPTELMARAIVSRIESARGLL